MVTPNYYSTGRYGSRMNAYSSYPERRAIAYPIHPDTRTTIMSERDAIDDVTPQRKRIAVACGRCRKRKIRCSGDTGNGGPCTNCKNAGYEPCQFLRVASQETHMKHDSFSYSLEASRQYQARGTSVVPSIPTTTSTSHYPDGLPVQASEPLIYRPTTFGYSTKPYYSLPWSNGYPDDQAISYVYQSSYPSVNDPDYGINFRMASGTVGKSSICVDTEPNYAYSSGTPSTSLVHRPAPVAADSSLTFQNMAAGVNMGDRVLPMPVGRYTSMPSSITSSYRNDSGSSVYNTNNYNSTYSSSTNSNSNSNSSSSSKSSQASTSGTSPPSPGSEPASSYTSYEPSSMATASSLSSSLASSMPSYHHPMSLAAQLTRSSNDLYSNAGSSDASLFTSADPMRGAGPGPDLTYRYTDTTTAAATAAATATARRDLPNLNSGSIGSASSFALGHGATTYMPHAHGGQHSGSYMLPHHGDVGGTGAEAAADSYRKAVGTLRA